jgi:hypothetical protein
MVTEKKCNGCNENKLVKYFYKNNASKDGYKTKCIECTKLIDKELKSLP